LRISFFDELNVERSVSRVFGRFFGGGEKKVEKKESRTQRSTWFRFSIFSLYYFADCTFLSPSSSSSASDDDD